MKGFRCPECNGMFTVIDSRYCKESGAVRRRRKCNDCGYRMTTYEMTKDDYEKFQKLHVKKIDEIVQYATKIKDIMSMKDDYDRGYTDAMKDIGGGV